MLRLKELRTKRGLRQIDFAKEMGILQSTLSSWENGRYEPDIEMLTKMASYFGVTVGYLMGKEPDSIPKVSGIRIPVLGEVAAGIPIEAVENIVDYEEIDAAMAATGEHFGLRLRGDSMEPRMKEGDVVIVRKQDDVDNGDVAVVLVNGDSATVKKIKKGADGIQLIPINPMHDIQFYSAEQVRTLPVRIIGKVVELRAKF